MVGRDRLDVFQARGDRTLNLFIKGRILVFCQEWDRLDSRFENLQRKDPGA